MKNAYVYLMASQVRGTLYLGTSSNLVKRVWEHRHGVHDGFTKRYAVHRLVWFELHANMMDAIRREKAIKKWNRAWKLELIEEFNPEWRDLYDDIAPEAGPPDEHGNLLLGRPVAGRLPGGERDS